MTDRTSDKSGDWLSPAVEAAANGEIAICRCAECGRDRYPPRELCPFCLSDRLEWNVSDGADGILLGRAILHHSNEAAFRPRLPLHVGLVQLRSGPTVVAFLGDGCTAGGRVKIIARLDESGRPTLTAIPAKE